MTYGTHNIIEGDCREVMAGLPERHFHCVVTSPPYFGLRDYGVDGQIGLEPTPDDFVDAMRSVFGGKDNPVGVWRVLRDDGVAWLNLGDSYAAQGGSGAQGATGQRQDRTFTLERPGGTRPPRGFKPKDLIGIPWRVALALQADGWYLRQDIIWHKRSPMPESVRDRCTKAHEYIFMLTKSARYFYDAEAVAEEGTGREKWFGDCGYSEASGRNDGSGRHKNNDPATTRNKRSVWTMSHEPFREAHFATYPRELPTTCIKASTSERGCCESCGAPIARVSERKRLTRERPNELTKRSGDAGTGNVCANTVAGVRVETRGWEPTCECGAGVVPCRVFDPFNGAGTSGVAACLLGRDYAGAELNPEYAAMARRRIDAELRPSTARVKRGDDSPLFQGAA